MCTINEFSFQNNSQRSVKTRTIEIFAIGVSKKEKTKIFQACENKMENFEWNANTRYLLRVCTKMLAVNRYFYLVIKTKLIEKNWATKKNLFK